MKLILAKTIRGKFPSLNSKWGVANGRMFVNHSYRKYVDALMRLSDGAEKTGNAVRLELRVFTYKDIDNLLKATIDGLKNCYDDDRQIVELAVTKEHRKRGTEDTIRIRVYDLEKSYIDGAQALSL